MPDTLTTIALIAEHAPALHGRFRAGAAKETTWQ